MSMQASETTSDPSSVSAAATTQPAFQDYDDSRHPQQDGPAHDLKRPPASPRSAHESANPCCPSAVRWPMVVAIAFTLAAIYFNCLMQVVNERRSELLERLPDLGHDALPYIANPWKALALADLAVIVVVVPVAVRTLFSSWRWTILKRWIVLLGFLFLLRGCTVVLTSLPPPRIDCELSQDSGRSVWLEALYIILGLSRTCRDLVFSGHTVNLTLAALVIMEYSHLNPVTSFDPAYGDFRCIRPSNPNVDYRVLPATWDERQPSGVCTGWMPAFLNPAYWGDPPQLVSEDTGEALRCTTTKLMVWVGAIAGWLLVIATHFHYSIDVLLAIILTVGSWNLYHAYVRNLDSRMRTHTLWLMSNRFFSWFERDAPDIPLSAAIYNSRFSRRYIPAPHSTLPATGEPEAYPGSPEFKQKGSPLAQPPGPGVARMNYDFYLKNGGVP